MLPLGYAEARKDRVALQLACEAKKEYLSTHITHLYSSTNPAALWNCLVKHCAQRPSGQQSESDFGDSYSELQLTYDGFHDAVYELLFGVTPEQEAALSTAEQERHKEVFFHHPFLSPATFLAFARSESATVLAVPMYAFAAKRMLLFRLRVELELASSAVPSFFLDAASRVAGRLPCPPSPSSPLSNGLTQDDIESFVANLLPSLRLVRDVPPWMLPYYLCHASRKFMFMCDTRGAGAISIDTIMRSDVFSELLRIFESDARDAVTRFPEGCPVEVAATHVTKDAPPDDTTSAVVLSYEGDGNDVSDIYTVQVLSDGTTLRLRRDELYWNAASSEYLPIDALNMDNWFSLPLMGRIYDHFTSLDEDGDGVLTKDELQQYSSAGFTSLAISRVFECHVPHSGGRHIMDYKTYLNFVIATEHAAARPAMKYLWSVLDLADTRTHITLSSLSCFCKELASELVKSALMSDISSESILSEIVDMINPAWHEWITFDDLVRSGQQATVLPVLLSHRNFYIYDCREQSAAAANDEYTETPLE